MTIGVKLWLPEIADGRALYAGNDCDRDQGSNLDRDQYVGEPAVCSLHKNTEEHVEDSDLRGGNGEAEDNSKRDLKLRKRHNGHRLLDAVVEEVPSNATFANHRCLLVSLTVRRG